VRLHAKPGWRTTGLVLLLLVPAFSPLLSAQATAGYHSATIISVRQVARNGFLVSRYSSAHVFTVDFTLRMDGHSYCIDYDTIVMQEVDDLRAAYQKEVQVDMQGKRLIIVLPSGRKIRAQLADSTQC
jgi:hypothetical protein